MNIQQLLIEAAEQGVFLHLEGEQLGFELTVDEFPEDIKGQVIERKDEIIEHLKKVATDANTYTRDSIEKAPLDGKPLPLSFGQQRLWFIDQLEGSSAQYNLPGAFALSAELDVAICEQTLGAIVERHEILRTVYQEIDGTPELKLLPWAPFSINRFDLSELDEAVLDNEISRLITEDSLKPFDLANDLMLRASYLELPVSHQNRGILLFNMHHIASDGWSLGVLLNEFTQIYSALKRSAQSNLPAQTIQYSDYALWQRNWLQGEVLESQLQYWTEQLSDAPQLHQLGLDFDRPEIKGYHAGVVNQHVNASTAERLNHVAQQANVTLFSVIHSAFALLLSRHANSNDIVIGTPVANRMQAQVESLIGLFVNTLVLRVDTEHSQFSDYLSHVGEVNRQAQAHQDLPFETIAEKLNLDRSTAHSPLFQILLTLDNTEKAQDTVAQPVIDLQPLKGGQPTTKFDLELLVQQSGDGLSFSWIYDINLFSHERIERLSDHLAHLLELIGDKQPMKRLLEPMRSELDFVLQSFNNTSVPVNEDTLVHQRFETMVQQNPDHLAVIFDDVSVSYAQLNAKANRLAYLLRDKGLAPQEPVGICLERSVDMVVAILAVLKAGGAYLPIEPSWPQGRIDYVIDNAELRLLLSHQAIATAVNFSACNTPLLLDSTDCQHEIAQKLNVNPEQLEQQSGNTLAYVIYTSGSTGEPKGAMIEHSAIVNRLGWMQSQYVLTSEDKVLQKTPYSFDVSVWEFLWTLGQGATLVVAKPQGHKDPEYLQQLITHCQVSVLHFVPSMLNLYLDKSQLPASVRLMFCSGEALTAESVKAVKQKAPHVALHNLYGPTEAAVDVSYFDCADDFDKSSVPIGKPVDNTHLYVMDAHHNILPLGALGELYISGLQLARGYLNQPELTLKNFKIVEVLPGINQRLYQTGDLARLDFNGQLHYAGRNDAQVKLRGLRVELAEIEHTLKRLSVVKEALVIVNDKQQLLAYVICHDGQNLTDWQQPLSAWLPEYMVPAHVTTIDAWPLSANGKVDRKKLPKPDIDSGNVYRAPEGEAEVLLASSWAQVLEMDVDRIGADDSFFALGGHSLLIIRYKSLLQAEGYDLPIAQLYKNLSLSQLAKLMVEAKQYKAPANLIAPGTPSITTDMLPMVELEQASLDAICVQVPGGAGNIQDIYSLSPLQKGILFHSLQALDGDPYVLKTLFQCESKQWAERFVEAFEFSMGRHDSLRTAVFYEGLEQPVQVVCREAKLPVNWLSESDLPAGISDIDAYLSDYQLPQERSIVIERAPLLHLDVIEYHGACYLVLFNHHLIEDNFSTRVLQHEVAAYMTGRQSELAPCAQYRDFIWRNLQVDQSQAEGFFEQMLGGFSEVVWPQALSYDKNAVAQPIEQDDSIAGMSTKVLKLDSDLAVAIERLAKTLSISNAAIYHLAWAVVMGRVSNQQDVVFGTVLSGRMDGSEGFDVMVGLCINTLPIRVELNQQPLVAVLKQTNDRLNNIVGYEQTALNEVVQFADIPAGSPLFNSILNFRLRGDDSENAELAEQMPGLSLMFGVEHTNYAISASVDISALETVLTIETMMDINSTAIADYFANALAAIAAQSSLADVPVCQLDVLSDSYQKFLLETLNQRVHGNEIGVMVHHGVAEQAKIRPEQLALVQGDEQLSYLTLNQSANRLAHLLKDSGINGGDAVGVCMERSPQAVLAMLAIYRCGGVFVPLDPQYPESRLQFMAQDTKAKVVLTGVQTQLPEFDSQVEVIDLSEQAIQQRLNTFDSEFEHCWEDPDSLAYIIYTSGSTGTPKGVMVNHREMAGQLAAEAAMLEITPDDNSLTFASIGFDAFAELSWTSLTFGATLHLPDEAIWALDKFSQYTKANSITIVDMPPTYLQSVMELDDFWQDATLSRVLTGGEAMAKTVTDRWQSLGLFNKCRLFNAYGPTETVMACHVYEVQPGAHSSVIGKPFGQRNMYVLDEQKRLLPFGVPGELYVGGSWLSQGYLNNPELSAERFIDDPFNESGKMYATGDLVCYLPNGELIFIDRIDNQVKVRGFRVELGEVERQLLDLAAVAACTVIADKDPQGHNTLIGYVIPVELKQVENLNFVQDLSQQLAKVLPHYMVPSAFVCLEQWPLNPNGKIDKKRLPKPERRSAAAFVEPVGECAKQLGDLWAQLLKLDKATLGGNSNFFELGGHSLLAVRLVSKVNALFELKHIRLDIKNVFVYPQLQVMAEQIDLLIVRDKNQQTQLMLDSAESVVEGEL